MKPLVTIGIVTYNRQDFLPDAIKSALAQDFTEEYEVLVVDDGSEESSLSLLKSISHPRLRQVFLNKNQGRPFARNTVVENMKGEYLLWLDDDDVLLKQALSSQWRTAISNPQADIIFCNLISCDEKLNPLALKEYKNLPEGREAAMMVFDNIVPNPCTLIKRSLFSRVGGYRAEFPRAQDYDFWARAAAIGATFRHNPEALILYRTHPGSASTREALAKNWPYHAAIARNIFASANIEKLFPNLDWVNQPQLSAARALVILATVLLKYNDIPGGAEALQLSLSYAPTLEAAVLQSLLIKGQGETDKAYEVLAEAVFANHPSFHGLLSYPCFQTAEEFIRC